MVDESTRYIAYARPESNEEGNTPRNRCCLTGRGKLYALSPEEAESLASILTPAEVAAAAHCISYQRVNVLGISFRAGEWNNHGTNRCGSVFCTKVAGKTRFGRLNRLFETCTGQGFASVSWFSTPVYPCFKSPLVVHVTLDDDSGLKTVLPIIDMEPSQILVEPYHDVYYMMRIQGYNSA